MIGNYSFIVGCNDAQHIWEAGVCFCNAHSDVEAILSLCNMRRAIARARLHTRLNFPRRANHRTRKKKYVRKKIQQPCSSKMCFADF